MEDDQGAVAVAHQRQGQLPLRSHALLQRQEQAFHQHLVARDGGGLAVGAAVVKMVEHEGGNSLGLERPGQMIVPPPVLRETVGDQELHPRLLGRIFGQQEPHPPAFQPPRRRQVGDEAGPRLCARMPECRQFTRDCHSEARSAGRGICFASGHNRFLRGACPELALSLSKGGGEGLGMTSIGLVRRTCNCFRTEPSGGVHRGRNQAPRPGGRGPCSPVFPRQELKAEAARREC